MLLVKTKVGASSIAGTGLFAEEFIPKGTIVWQFSSDADEAHTEKQVQELQEPKRSEILSLFHSYISKQTGRYIFFEDNAGYMNHSTTPNVGVRYEAGIEEDIDFAIRDINPGEEITIDYREFADEGVDFNASN